MSCQSDYLSLIQTNTHLNHFTADTTIYAVFINGLYIGSKFCLTATLDTFNAFTPQKISSVFKMVSLRLLGLKKKAITEKQKLLTAAFCFCLHLACKVTLLTAFQAGFTFWFLSDNYQGPSTGQSCKIHNWGCECNLFWLTEIQATQVKPHFHSCCLWYSLSRQTFWRSAKAF